MESSYLETLLKKMFPYEGVTFGRGGEVNGLPQDAVPHASIIDRFVRKSEKDREFFFVELDGVAFLLRICSAYPDSGYAKFAVVHKTSLTTPVPSVRDTFDRWKECL